MPQNTGQESHLQGTPVALKSAVSKIPPFLTRTKSTRGWGWGSSSRRCSSICQPESQELAQPSVCHALSLHLSELTAKLFLAQTMNMHGDRKHEARGITGEASGECCSF